MYEVFSLSYKRFFGKKILTFVNTYFIFNTMIFITDISYKEV